MKQVEAINLVSLDSLKTSATRFKCLALRTGKTLDLASEGNMSLE